MDMTLFLTAFDRQSNPLAFSYRLESLEKGFKVLNHLVAGGHTLRTAYVLDKNGRTNLPVAAFVQYVDAQQCSIFRDNKIQEVKSFFERLNAAIELPMFTIRINGV